jgi:histidine ammonia-lyase
MAYQLIREHIPHLNEDRELYKEIGTMVAVMRSGALVDAVESAVGEIKGYA